MKKNEENKISESENTEKKEENKNQPKKFNNLELVIESSSINKDNNTADDKKDIKDNNNKLAYSIQEERTELCFVSNEQNNENNIEKKDEPEISNNIQDIKDKSFL